MPYRHLGPSFSITTVEAGRRLKFHTPDGLIELCVVNPNLGVVCIERSPAGEFPRATHKEAEYDTLVGSTLEPDQAVATRGTSGIAVGVIALGGFLVLEPKHPGLPRYAITSRITAATTLVKPDRIIRSRFLKEQKRLRKIARAQRTPKSSRPPAA